MTKQREQEIRKIVQEEIGVSLNRSINSLEDLMSAVSPENPFYDEIKVILDEYAVIKEMINHRTTGEYEN